MKQVIIACAVLSATVMSTLHAAEVTSEQAEIAVKNWIRISPNRMNSWFGSENAENTETVRSRTGRAIFHAVNLKGGGFVITSGDTRLTPIIAFSDAGSYIEDETNPLYALLHGDQSRAVYALEQADRQFAAAAGNAGSGYTQSQTEAMSEWASLLSATATSGGTGVDTRMFGETGDLQHNGVLQASISDMRVAPLLRTEWGQSGYSYDSSYYPAFDYYIYENSTLENWPNLPCGCVATAGAQLMYYWRSPRSIGSFENTCYLVKDPWNPETTTYPKQMQSKSGTVDYNSMFKTWDDDYSPPSETAREAVGRLTYNIAVAIGMTWSSGSGSGSTSVLIDKLKTQFGYKSGTMVWYDIESPDYTYASRPSNISEIEADFNNALYASLDAKMPVLMGITGEGYEAGSGRYSLAHALLADGYGYMSGNRYTHLNFGYDGGRDAWYHITDNMICCTWEGYPYDYENYYHYSGLGFNIHPTVAGDVISGRVLNSSKSPVNGATVTLYNSLGNAVRTASTDAKGIYSLRVTTVGDYTVKATSGDLESTAKAVSVPSLSVGNDFVRGGKTGNRWGNDLTVATTPTYTVTLDQQGGSGGTTSVNVKYDHAMPDITVPTKSGYTFGGYFSGKDGVNPQFYTAAGKSATAWNRKWGSTIYAKWTPTQYTVTLDKQDGTGGSSSVKVAYGAAMPDITVPTRDGYTFGGYFSGKDGVNPQFYTAAGKSATAWNRKWGSIIYAKWIANGTEYKVTLDQQGGSGGTETVKVQYDIAMPTITVPTKAGYIFQGYFSGQNGTAPKFYDKNGKSALNWNRKWGSTIYAHWKASPTYTITLDAQGGMWYLDNTSTKTVTVKYGEPMPGIVVPTRSGFDFLGFFSGKDGTAPQYYDMDGNSARTWNREWGSTIYAKWKKLSEASALRKITDFTAEGDQK